MEALKLLNSQHISKLFSNLPIGDYAKFEHKLEEWRKNLENFDCSYNVPSFGHSELQIGKKTISVMEILTSTHSGKEILNYYAKNNYLQEEQRTLLINTIAKYIDLNGIHYSLSDCAEMEKDICNIFETENLVRFQKLRFVGFRFLKSKIKGDFQVNSALLSAEIII